MPKARFVCRENELQNVGLIGREEMQNIVNLINVQHSLKISMIRKYLITYINPSVTVHGAKNLRWKLMMDHAG